MTNGILLPVNEIEAQLKDGAFDAKLTQLYGVSGAALLPFRERISQALHRFCEIYGEQPVCVFSVPGRTELGGNHTDHQNGKVLAAGIGFDILAVAAPTDDGRIRVQSEGFPEDVVSCGEGELEPDSSGYGSSAALIRGTAAHFAKDGIAVNGFCAYTVSDVPKGGGLSSSAAFEVMIGTICNTFFAGGKYSPAEIAQIAQHAENVYFGKPCGLMDQMACSVGSVITIDFADPGKPVYETVALDPRAQGYRLCLIDSGADHADLTDEYVAVPGEMRAAAKLLGAKALGETDEADFWAKFAEIRQACGDRAALRAYHFYRETKRAGEMFSALKAGDFAAYLRLVNASGRSSALWLQNIYPAGSTKHQALAAVLAFCEARLADRGAYRVHGGGFAGMVQVYIPEADFAAFSAEAERIFGAGACMELHLRTCGASALWETKEAASCC